MGYRETAKARKTHHDEMAKDGLKWGDVKPTKTMKPWIGVDFDGTLSHGSSGDPIPRMVERVRRWLKEGKIVKIVSARANPSFPSAEHAVEEVKEFCKWQFGEELEITYSKDHMMLELWDDRAVQVEHNTGIILGKEIRRPI